MIVGSGLLASAFRSQFSESLDVVIYAAGVSNSTSVDASSFLRERQRLAQTIASHSKVDFFVYFSTCSVLDAEVRGSAYVRHKLEMETLVAEHKGFLIVRLPQLAGRTNNPHTLLNFLYSQIMQSKRFSVWKYARRNIIDIDDVARIVGAMVGDTQFRRCILDVASPSMIDIVEVVRAFEGALGREAVFDEVERGRPYNINVTRMMPIAERTGVQFGGDYLARTINKYYSGAG